MIVLLSPAKTLDFDAPAGTKTSTLPEFTKRSAKLMKTLRELSAKDLGELMKLSEKLSELNFDRNRAWKAKHDEKNSKQAVYAFQGDVYQGLSVDELNATEVRRCQKHVRILSGLYGMLRPLDLMQPYRLEMGTKLKTDSGKDLYAYWGETIRDAISAELRAMKSDLIVNLASNEYSKVAKLKSIEASVISPVFKDWKNGQYKLISFFAKRARGMMTRHLVTQKTINLKTINLKTIQSFAMDGYKFDKKLSTETEPVFTRKAKA